MLVDIDTADPRPVYRQIVDEIRRCVSIGILKPDEPLPAVRTLAAELKINANTVQHAYRTLVQDGAVYVKRGLGTFVSARGRDQGRGKPGAVARQIAEAHGGTIVASNASDGGARLTVRLPLIARSPSSA